MRQTWGMGLLDRFRRQRPGTTRRATSADEAHLRDFIATRKGVEGFVEPQTTFNDTTLLLVAYDGEWTRRRVPSVQWAHAFTNKLGVPAYDAGLVGIPDRMREWNRRQRKGDA